MSFSHPRQSSVQHLAGFEVYVETDNKRLVDESNHLKQLINSASTTYKKEATHLLYFGDRGIEVKPRDQQGHNGQRVDFLKVDYRTGAGNLSKKQPLPKAVGSYHNVVDATAGFGLDSIRLALMGYTVTAIERSPILAAMLRDGLWRAKQDEHFKLALGDRLTLIEGDAAHKLQTIESPEVVYIDPMFPPKRKKSALPPGHIQTLQAIVGFEEPEETNTLFEEALHTTAERVVVKRPDHAPQLGPVPVAVHKGKLVRYEVYRLDTANKKPRT